MATKKKEEDPIDKILKLIDKEVAARGKAVLAEVDATERIAELASEAKRKGAPMRTLTEHIKRMDKNTRELAPVTRQAADTMLAVHEKRRAPRTTRASRRRSDSKTAGKVNSAALK